MAQDGHDVGAVLVFLGELAVGLLQKLVGARQGGPLFFQHLVGLAIEPRARAHLLLKGGVQRIELAGHGLHTLHELVDFAGITALRHRRAEIPLTHLLHGGLQRRERLGHAAAEEQQARQKCDREEEHEKADDEHRVPVDARLVQIRRHANAHRTADIAGGKPLFRKARHIQLAGRGTVALKAAVREVDGPHIAVLPGTVRGIDKARVLGGALVVERVEGPLLELVGGIEGVAGIEPRIAERVAAVGAQGEQLAHRFSHQRAVEPLEVVGPVAVIVDIGLFVVDEIPRRPHRFLQNPGLGEHLLLHMARLLLIGHPAEQRYEHHRHRGHESDIAHHQRPAAARLCPIPHKMPPNFLLPTLPAPRASLSRNPGEPQAHLGLAASLGNGKGYRVTGVPSSSKAAARALMSVCEPVVSSPRAGMELTASAPYLARSSSTSPKSSAR